MADTELILKIINGVKKRDCLWNIHSAEYAKRDKLEKAWQEISVDIGKPENFCREKWRNVRTGFLRSIQYNTNILCDNGDGSEDLPTPRRKRFYLFDEMKFLLQATESTGQVKKKQKLSRSAKSRNSIDDPSGDNVDASTIQSISGNKDSKHFTNINDTNQSNISTYPDVLNELQLSATSSTKPSTRQSEAALALKMDQLSPPPPMKIDEEKEEQVKHSTPMAVPSGGTQCEIGNNTKSGELFNPNANRNECDNRDEEQLLAFFRGNIDDILSLPRHKQRLFKRRMLELIDDLHRPENGLSSSSYCP
ncbi:unnamed protein product [Ceratitis capitata]|uniref:(Mediterranean fruit fly) hypothetical protein n=1 Tax=Ceratitis capitata TaxID=7213 RepID=A0A811V0D3_CERCA|nr:unnamed protein product [Ceratitis capitata]